MSHLICLGIVSRDANVQLNLESFSPPPLKLQKLTLKGRLTRGNLPSWFGCLRSLMVLRLHSSELTEDSIRLLSSLPRLFDLSIWDAYKEERLTFTACGFPVLRKLRLQDLPSLAHLEFQKGSLVDLQRLMLGQCAELIEIPQGIENLIHLKNLELFEMSSELTRKIQERQESGGNHQTGTHVTIVKDIRVHDGPLLEEKNLHQPNYFAKIGIQRWMCYHVKSPESEVSYDQG
uniref:Disease resistance R13L4/SHOC-2-like LRR domain-containing protein n=1 Tax=Arundo donax TaxID=35708 RepID=A0A0A9HY65_ARUDO